MLKKAKFHSEKSIFSWYSGYLYMRNVRQSFYIQLKLCPFPSKDSFIQIALEWSILVVRTSYLYENNAEMLEYILPLSVNFCAITKNTIHLTANLSESQFFWQKALHFGFYQEIYNSYIFFNYFMLKSTKFRSEKVYYVDILDICVCVMCARSYI